MKTKDVRALPPELRELAKLALSFKNKYRNDSDTAVVRMILALYDDTKRKVQVRIVSWALKVMRHDVVSPLARPLLVDFLMSDKVTLSEKQLKRYERAQAEAAAPKVKGKKKIEYLETGKEACRLDTSSHLVYRACRFLIGPLPLRPARTRTRRSPIREGRNGERVP